MASILELPPTTIRRLGSSQALTDASSVVKELVENALDARASNISVEISVNTLDVVHVRDNGHGIIPEDRVLACKRFCTSKIKEFLELDTIGGSSLGFRGEALASLADMSASLTITTRVEGEAVAVNLNIDQDGSIKR